jgi:hypothetical protein
LGVVDVGVEIIEISHAREVRSVICVPASFVLRKLRIGAEWPGKSNVTVRRHIVCELGRDDFVRCYALFDPAIHSGDDVVVRVLRVTRDY